MSASIIIGDCLEAMARLPDNLVDAVVTDPPYHLQSVVKRFGKPGSAPVKVKKFDGQGGSPFARAAAGFMGKTWDGGDISMNVDTWRAVLRVMKPGAHLLAFGGTRTHHRIWCAIEDAGFEIRDTVFWMYGSGFPKSHNTGDGRGTALKPAVEPICLARKPLIGTVAENIAAWGTGAINIDSCRVKAEARPLIVSDRRVGANGTYGDGLGGSLCAGSTSTGRWPANVIHDGSDEVLAAFPVAPGQQGALTGSEPSPTFSGKIFGKMRRPLGACEPRGDTGSAARFFYCAKASKADREEGCDELPARLGGMRSETSGQHIIRRDGGDPKLVKNDHPTVKPTALMQYLCRLVTPTGGLILDPFMGSGSTGKAALKEGFRFLGIEKDEHYADIARCRIGGGATVHRLSQKEAAE